MRILAVADAEHPALYSHFERSRWSEVQLVLGCGDLSAEYLDFVATSLGVPLIYVRGNHDSALHGGGSFLGENADGKIITFGGLRFLGFEGSAWYGGKGIEYSEKDMTWRVWRTFLKVWLAGGVDVVISHAPPRLRVEDAPAAEVAETVLRVSRPERYTYVTAEEGPTDAPHRGFAAFNSLIGRFRPRLWLHGHAHLNYSRAARVRRLGDTLVTNAFQYVLCDVEPLPRRR